MQPLPLSSATPDLIPNQINGQLLGEQFHGDIQKYECLYQNTEGSLRQAWHIFQENSYNFPEKFLVLMTTFLMDLKNKILFWIDEAEKQK